MASRKKDRRQNKLTKRKKYEQQGLRIYLSIIGHIVILVFISVVLMFNHLYISKNIHEIDSKLESLSIEWTLESISPHYVFLGDSITQQFELSKYFKGYSVVNSGQDGAQTEHILNDMEEKVYRYNPSTVFIMIGTNDVNENKSVEHIYNNINKIVDEIKINLPHANIVVQSILPSQERWTEHDDNKKRQAINNLLANKYHNSDVIYLDLYSIVVDNKTNKLKDEYTDDGLHLNSKSYNIVSDELKHYMSMHTK